MLIADSILRMKENEEYTFICICYGYNDKYDLYFNRINDKASYSFLYQVLSVNKIGRFFDLLRYKKNIVKSSIKNLIMYILQVLTTLLFSLHCLL